MTEYKDKVEQHALLLEAEAWAKKVDSIHTFNSDVVTMGYDYPNTSREGYVTDKTYNDGTVERVVHKSGKTKYFGKPVKGDKLIDIFRRSKNDT